jgi:hypothetical protein
MKSCLQLWTEGLVLKLRYIDSREAMAESSPGIYSGDFAVAASRLTAGSGLFPTAYAVG